MKMTNIETMRLALEALKCLLAGNSTAHQAANAITALRQAIEQAQQAEPDYYGLTRDHLWMSITKDHHDRLKPEFRMACYTAPPPRQPEQETDGIALTNIHHPKGAPATDDLNVDALEVVELELPDEDEAVAWADGGVINWIAGKQFKHASYLYATPPPRQPLTPERVFSIADQHPIEGFDPDIMAFARAIEAAVWEKQK